MNTFSRLTQPTTAVKIPVNAKTRTDRPPSQVPAENAPANSFQWLYERRRQSGMSMSRPGDPLEREADRAADQVISAMPRVVFGIKSGTPASDLVSRQAGEEEVEKVQALREGGRSALTTASFARRLNSGTSAGHPLSGEVKQKMEAGFGNDFSAVRVHTGAEAEGLNNQIGARAFTWREQIYFNRGEFNPASREGMHLLAHELAHVVQQGGGKNRFSGSEVYRQAASTEADTCEETIRQEITTFRSHGVFGPQPFTPSSTNTGGFMVSYDPASEVLRIAVLGRTRFVNGLVSLGGPVVMANETNLSELARLISLLGDETLATNIVPFYTWTDSQKDASKALLADRIRDTVSLWQDAGMNFRVDDPCWEEVKAFPEVDIQVEEEGEASLNTATSSGSDNLQVTLVKNPAPAEVSVIRSAVNDTLRRVQDERQQSLAYDPQTRFTTGARVSTTTFTHPDRSQTYRAEMILSSEHLERRPGDFRDMDSALLRRSVFFKHDEFVLDEGDKRMIDSFITDFREADSNASNSAVTLIGHASRPGSTSYNTRLVQRRLNSVKEYLRGRNFQNINTRVSETNQADTIAENLPETEQTSALLRRVEIVVGTGELQTTVAHEFGHVFGLKDEYVTRGTSFSGTGLAAGDVVGHSQMSEDIGAGQVVAENSDNIMSMGNEVRAQHYGSFGAALRRLTGKNWKVEE